VNPALSLGGSNWRYWGLLTQLAALGFAYLVAACCAGHPGRLRVLLRSVAAGGLIVAAYGIAQYFGWDPLLDARGYHTGEGIFAIVRPPSTLGHADYSANWLLFVVFAAAALLWGGQSWPQPPFRRPEPAESRLRAELPAPLKPKFDPLPDHDD
jgi:hypothetical protein